MAFSIRKTVRGGCMWLKATAPVVKRGPEYQAKTFRTIGEPRQVNSMLPAKELPARPPLMPIGSFRSLANPALVSNVSATSRLRG